jgi:hypothetical protein
MPSGASKAAIRSASAAVPGAKLKSTRQTAAGAEWGLEARAARAADRHPVGGAVRLATLEIPVADAAGVAERYGAELGIAFSEGWRVVVGHDQSIVLREGGGAPVVELEVEAGTPPLDVERFGVRWRRTLAVPSPAGPGA